MDRQTTVRHSGAKLRTHSALGRFAEQLVSAVQIWKLSAEYAKAGQECLLAVPVGSRLSELAPRGQRERGGGFTQPRAHLIL